MPVETNQFKARLKAGETLIGLWLSLGEATTAELAAGTGFDWLVVDGEHGPNRLRDILGQLRAIGTRTDAVVRSRDDDRAEIKQLLDIGARTLLVPMIESAAQAREVIRSALYPPEGVRGVGAALGRASGYGETADYLATANDELCLLVQIESRAGLEQLDEILALDRLDGVFIGPADLSADMGFPGRSDAPEVQAAIRDALLRIHAAGKASGILTSDPVQQKAWHDLGVGFLAIGADVSVLRAGLLALRASAPTG